MNTIPLEPPEPEEPARPAGSAHPSEPETPETPEAPETTAAPPASGAVPPERQRSSARTGTIVWGVLILIFCAIVLQRTVAPGTFDPVIWVTGVVLGLGALLLVVAVAVILRSRR